MIKIKKLMLIMLLPIFAIVFFAGCGSASVQLTTPTYIYTESTNGVIRLMTMQDPNASSYVFGFYSGTAYENFSNYAEIESDTASFDITSIVNDSRIYYFYVKAVGDGINYLDSSKSEVYLHDNTGTLPSPVLELDSGEAVLNWDAIAYSDGYVVYKNNIVLQETTETSLNISEVITEMIEYDFQVIAKGIIGSSTYNDSYRSNTVSYIEHLRLEAPENLSITEEIIQDVDSVYLDWDYVSGASGYEIVVNNDSENPVTTVLSALDVTNLLTEGRQYSFKVRAKGSGISADSNYSEIETYDNYFDLATPTITGATRNGENVIVSWSEIENAYSYTLIVNDVIFDSSIYTNQIQIPGTLELEAGGFNFEVYANTINYFLQSDTSVLYYYNGLEQLMAPTATIDDTSGDAILSWVAVNYATGYRIAINNDIYYTTENTFNLSDNMDSEQAYEINIKTVGQAYMEDSEYQLVEFYNNTDDFITSYSSTYYYYYGYFDYNITSQEELNNLLAYSMMRHETGITAYIDFDLTNSEEISADVDYGDNNGSASTQEIIDMKQLIALQDYTETHSMSYYPPSLEGGTKEYEFNYEYDTDLIPSLVSNDPSQILQNENWQPFSSDTGRLDTYDDFINNDSFIEITVANSNELFEVVNSGAKPLFVGTNSTAEQCYEEAKDVLRDIIDDDMSDYEKMLAIYDWVCYNVVYDSYIYNLAVSEPGNDDIQNYNSFYLEGVFLDGVAVCDGISKAVALLANMEGIEAIKINGTANGSGHAWNKVNLDEWYVIDATWADIQINNGEALTQQYFLVTDVDISDHTAASNYNPVADTVYDYYQSYEYVDGYNYYVTTQEELNHLIEYLTVNLIEGVQVKLLNFTNVVNALNTANINATEGVDSFDIYTGIGDDVYILDLIYS